MKFKLFGSTLCIQGPVLWLTHNCLVVFAFMPQSGAFFNGGVRFPGYRIENDPTLPSWKKAPRGRRFDPHAGLFDEEVVPLLRQTPALRPGYIFDEPIRRHPELSPGIRHSLERRVRCWQTEYGEEQEVIFRQCHEPGWL